MLLGFVRFMSAFTCGGWVIMAAFMPIPSSVWMLFVPWGVATMAIAVIGMLKDQKESK